MPTSVGYAAAALTSKAFTSAFCGVLVYNRNGYKHDHPLPQLRYHASLLSTRGKRRDMPACRNERGTSVSGYWLWYARLPCAYSLDEDLSRLNARSTRCE